MTIRVWLRKAAGVLFIDWRFWTEKTLVGLLVAGYFLSTNASGFEASMSPSARAALYATLAGVAGALLGFVLAALAVLVALPSSERLEALRAHPNWARVPSSYIRASLGLFASVIICTLGIVLDGGQKPRQLYEAITVVIVAFALVRVLASVVALDQILSVANAPRPPKRAINDP